MNRPEGNRAYTTDQKDRLLAFVAELAQVSGSFSQQVLKLMAKHFNYRHLLFFPYTSAGAGGHKALINNFTSYNIDYKYLNMFARVSYKTNIFNPSNLPPRDRLKKVLTVRSLMSYEEYERTEWCRDLQMMGAYYHACIHLLNQNRSAQTASLNIFRAKEEGDFTDSEVALLEYLSDYLSSMFQMQIQMSGDQGLEASVNGAMKNLALGAVYLDDQMTVLEANNMARTICKQFLEDFSGNLVSRSLLDVAEDNLEVQRVISDMCLELMNGSTEVKKRSNAGTVYTFYPAGFTTSGVMGLLSSRYLVFIHQGKPPVYQSKEFTNLTPREREILGYVLKGLGNEEISRALNVSIFTVRTHISNLYHKLGVKNRVELLMKIKS